MYNLSGLQKGIQAGHAALEYVDQFGNEPEYREFIDNHKTWIILDGGGSKEMETYHALFHELKINYAIFREPDLNNSVSALCFLVPESVYNREHPEYFSENYYYADGPVPELVPGSSEWLTKFLSQFTLARN